MRDIIRKHREFILYGLCGIPTVASNLAVFFVLTNLAVDISTAVCNALAVLASILVAYFSNKLFVFHSKRDNRIDTFKEFFSFLSSRLVTGTLEVVLMVVLVDFLKLGEYEPWVKLGAMVVVIMLNYIISKKIIFKES